MTTPDELGLLLEDTRRGQMHRVNRSAPLVEVTVSDQSVIP